MAEDPEELSEALRRFNSGEMGAAYNIPVKVSTVLGHANIKVSKLMKLTSGAVLDMNRKVGEPIDIHVNQRLVARGELVVVDDRLGVTITEVIRSGSQAQAMN